MGCGIACIKYLLFIFNFIFALLGLAILAVGVVIHLQLTDVSEFTDIVSAPSIVSIVIGSVIFVIAFFGCCGAIRESHCMVITFGVFLLTIVIAQVAIGIWAFVISKNVQTSDWSTQLTTSYEKAFNNYWVSETDRAVIDSVQSSLSCCGITSPSDFQTIPSGTGTIPWSCCGTDQSVTCSTTTAFQTGCVSTLTDAFKKYSQIIGGVAIGVAAVQIIGIIFAFCLANSIRNDDRRGYRV